MKITIEIEECEGTRKEVVEHQLKRFLKFNFQKGEKAKVTIE